jgi:hypothetical protein
MFPLFLLLAILEMRRRDRRWMLRCAVASVGLAAALTPWTVHNYRALHFAGPVRDNFWLECWAGNNGDTFESNAVWAHPASNAEEMQRYEAAGEIRYIAEKKALALNFIEQNPKFFAELSLRRAFSYWTGFWSFSPAYLHKEPLEIADVFFCTGVTVLMLLGARRFWRRDAFSALPYLVLIAVFPITYYVTHATSADRTGGGGAGGDGYPVAEENDYAGRAVGGDDGRRRETVDDVDVRHWAVAERRGEFLIVEVAELRGRMYLGRTMNFQSSRISFILRYWRIIAASAE